MANLTTAQRTTLSLLLRTLSGDVAAIDTLFGVSGSDAERTSQINLLLTLAGQRGAIDTLFGLTADGSPYLSAAERASAQGLLLALSGDPASLDALSLGYNPTGIPNLALWMDGRASAYSDSAGTVLATDPAGRVRRTDQPSPLAGSWLTSSDPLRPMRESAYFDFAMGAGQKVAQPVGVTLPANNATVGIAITMRDNPPGTGQFILTGNDGVGSWGVWVFSNNIILIYREGAYWQTNVVLPTGSQSELVIRWTPTGAKLDYVIGGVAGSVSETATISARTAQALNVGDATAGNPMHAALSQIVGYSRALSDTETATLLSGLKSQPAPANFPTNAPLVVVAGDSIPRGFGLTPPQAYPFLMQPNLWGTAPARLVNTAVSGYTLAQMATDYPTKVKPWFSASRARNILLAAGATNSMAFGSLTEAQVLSAYYAYCDQAKADGFYVVLCTVFPRTDAGIRGTFDADRLAFNTDVRANWASHGHALADLGNISGMSLSTDSTGVNFQSDHVHPSAAGGILAEAVARAAVLTLLP